MGRRGDSGEIQGRSIDLGGSVFRSVGSVFRSVGSVFRSVGSVFRSVIGSIGKGTRREGAGAESKVTRMRARGGLGGEGEDETWTIVCGGVLRSLVRSDEGRSEERGEKKT